MKIAIVAPTPIPFLVGGAEKFFWGLQSAINRLTPHDAELIKIPCRDQEFWPLMDAYYRFCRLDLTYFDRVISTKYPAWMLSHPAHDVYMQHTCRGVYDLYHRSSQSEILPRHKTLNNLLALLECTSPEKDLLEPFFQELFALRDRSDVPVGLFDFPSPLTRKIIRFLDSIALSPNNIQRYFSISKNVLKRDGYFPAGVDVRVINHPTDIQGFYCQSYDYIFTASRLEDLKRVHLLVEAFKKVDIDIPFKIAGTGGQEALLRQMAAGDDRIEFLGFVSDAELIDYYAGALFVPFIPYDEDYGLITLEAMLSEKAVLTVHDAGGVTELVKDGVNGYIVNPDPHSLAQSMTKLINNRDETIAMGYAARESVQHINWENTIEPLFSQPLMSGFTDFQRVPQKRQQAERKKIVMVNTFSVHHPVSGGQKRVFHLCQNLGLIADVTLVVFGNPAQGIIRQALCEGVTEIRVPKSQAQADAESALRKELKASADDIAAIEGYLLNPDYCNVLEQVLQDSDLVICAHPYLYRAVRHGWKGNLWLDSHNVEADMKAVVLPPSKKRDEVLAWVRDVEQACVMDADLLSCVSEGDINRFKELYGTLPKTVVVPNGMVFKDAQVIPNISGESLRKRLGLSVPVVVFVGSNHGPNNEALQTLFNLAELCCDIAFLVIGSVCDFLQESLILKNIRLLGVLSESEKNVVLRAANLALNPVCAGGGSNLKIIEYIAFRIPVLSTPCGVRGFDLSNDRHVWLRDISDFPEAIRQMISPERKEEISQMSAAAYDHAAATYDWAYVSKALTENL